MTIEELSQQCSSAHMKFVANTDITSFHGGGPIGHVVPTCRITWPVISIAWRSLKSEFGATVPFNIFLSKEAWLALDSPEDARGAFFRVMEAPRWDWLNEQWVSADNDLAQYQNATFEDLLMVPSNTDKTAIIRFRRMSAFDLSTCEYLSL